jgi:succinate dehydrogenase / fumarate reductase cytochrome b subunit
MPDRPLSPHLTLYKLRYTLVSSIVNRGTGLALSAGLLLLLYWIMAIFGGPQSYARAEVVLSHPVFKLVLTGFMFAFSYHLIAGIRHLIWDTAHGMERKQSQTSAWAVGILSVLMTLALAYWAFCPAGVR